MVIKNLSYDSNALIRYSCSPDFDKSNKEKGLIINHLKLFVPFRAPSDREDFDFEKTSTQAESKPLVVPNDVDVLIKGEKLTDEEENERAVDIDKAGEENFDSEEETGE